MLCVPCRLKLCEKFPLHRLQIAHRRSKPSFLKRLVPEMLKKSAVDVLGLTAIESNSAGSEDV
jgi:hypothetical protein